MKKISMILIFLFLLGEVFGYYSERMNISEDQADKTVVFNITKINNYTYNLKFIHYGNLQEDMQVNIYVNDHLVYKINDSNDGSPAYKKNVTVNITNYLKNGKNILKIEGINIVGNESYHPYYVLKEVCINEPVRISMNGNFELVIVVLTISGVLVCKGDYDDN